MEPDLGYKLTTFCRPFQFMTYRFHRHLFHASFHQKQAAFRWLMLWFNASSWHMTNSSFSQCQRTSYRLTIPWHFILIFPIRTFILYQYNSHSVLLTHVVRVFIIILFSSPFDVSFSVFLLCLYLPCSRWATLSSLALKLIDLTSTIWFIPFGFLKGILAICYTHIPPSFFIFDPS